MTSKAEEEMMMKGGGEICYEGSSEPWYAISKKKALVLFLVVFLIVLLFCILVGVFATRYALESCGTDAQQEKVIVGTEVPSSSGTTPTERPTGPEPWYKVRLPRYIKPVHYDMTITTDFASEKYSGESDIEIDISEATEYVLIHKKEMSIDETKIVDNATRKIQYGIKNTFYYDYNQFWVIEMNDKLEPGVYNLHLKFSANISIELNGYYLSKYNDENGVEKKLATTDFEPTDARKAFPCFDEPAMKAEYTTHLIHDKDHHGLSNMPVVDVADVQDGLKKTTFNRSVAMSTYLVAFIVSDFESKKQTSKTRKKTEVGVWSIPSKVNTTQYALQKGVDVLEFLEKYYDVDFPLPKQDMIAIPDFNSGAMENWGLITYRETALLYEEGVNSAINKQRVAVVIAHELAHQWFGNIVSPEWWDDLWLNEGFASFVEYYGTNHTEPDWQMMEQFVVLDLYRVMNMDSLATSHPIIMPLERPEEIRSVFDRISYSKGASVLRMLENFMGKDTFKAGLTSYLNKFKYKNTKSQDLWAALTNQTGGKMNIGQIMDTWTLQMGFPLITIKKVGEKAKISQKHFLLDPDVKITRESKYNYKWYVPFTYFSDKNSSSTQVWMNMEDASFTWPSGAKWVKGNFEQKGYYRTHYDLDNWNNLIKVLKTKHEDFNPADRAGLIDDAFTLARAGMMDYELALNLSMYLREEKDYVPWRQGIRSVGFLRHILSSSGSYGKYKKHLLHLLEPLATELELKDSTGDSHLKTFLRIYIMDYACFLGDEGCNKNATTMFKDWKDNKKPVDPNIRSIVYQYGVANGDSSDWDYVYEMMKAETDSAEKGKLRSALSATKEMWILQRYLEYSLDTTKVKSQDTVGIINSVASNVYGRNLAWTFARANFEELKKRYAGSSFTMSNLISGITSSFSTKFMLQEVTDFFDKNPDVGSGANAVEQAKESIQSKIDWLEKYESKISDWLDKQSHI